jgi:glycerophosphoryl diester phosphodiesterase
VRFGRGFCSSIGRRAAVLALAGLFLMAAACVTAGDAGAPAGRRVLKVAHRGGAGLAPENTLASFRSGMDHGADAVELDVHLSSDGELVVMHDPEVSRTTDGSGEIGRKSLAEIRRLDASAKFPGASVGQQAVPRLQEVLDLVKGRCGVQIEIKVRTDGSRYAGIEEKVVQAVRQSGMVDQAVVLSFDFPSIAVVKAIEPRLRTCALATKAYFQGEGKSGPAAVAAQMEKLDVDFMGVEKSWLSLGLYDALRARGIGVGVWTVDDEATMRRFAAMGVDFITSNRPDLLDQVFPPAVGKPGA